MRLVNRVVVLFILAGGCRCDRTVPPWNPELAPDAGLPATRTEAFQRFNELQRRYRVNGQMYFKLMFQNATTLRSENLSYDSHYSSLSASSLYVKAHDKRVWFAPLDEIDFLISYETQPFTFLTIRLVPETDGGAGLKKLPTPGARRRAGISLDCKNPNNLPRTPACFRSMSTYPPSVAGPLFNLLVTEPQFREMVSLLDFAIHGPADRVGISAAEFPPDAGATKPEKGSTIDGGLKN